MGRGEGAFAEGPENCGERRFPCGKKKEGAIFEI